ncbi:hypothetical protein [Aliiroseovarius sp. xm-m-339-2]|nr:hypothetical protein [Aliiroseovarius sp. xm-m-339-2]
MSFLDRIRWAWREKRKNVLKWTLLCAVVESYALYLLIENPDWWVESIRYSVWTTRLVPIVIPVAYLWGILTLVDQK